MGGTDPIRRRLDEWKRRLVDLSRRNRLLYFRPGSGFTMELEEPGLDEVFLSIHEHERPWRVWEPPDKPSGEEDVQALPECGEVEAKRPSANRPRRSGELKLRAVGRRDWKTAIAGLRLRARTAYEEAGLRILHFSLGTLAWRDQETGEEALSPIVLLPVELRRESRRAPYALHPADEEPVLNPALLIRLDRDFNQKLPELPDDWEAMPPSDYLAQLTDIVAPRGWTVRAHTYLSLFSFLKLVIYKDLETNEAVVRGHPVIRTMAGEEDASLVGGSLPQPTELDETLEPKESFLVVDADSSQLAALQAVKQGRSLVIQGPPGTGKSQTITNLLAEMIAAGKSVLFVSEKMAALEVVRNRLRAAHLDHYCLELHSHKANKREVVRELYRTYTNLLEPRSAMSDEEYARLVRRRAALNDYVRELHRRREPLGRTVYEVLGELAGLRGAPAVLWTAPEEPRLTPERLSEVLDLTRGAVRVWPIVLEDSFPWQGCLDADYSPGTRDAWLRMLADGREAIDRLRIETAALAATCGCPAPENPAEVGWLIETANLLESTTSPPRHWLIGTEIGAAMDEARRWLEYTRTYRERRERLLARFRPTIFELPDGLIEPMREAAGRLQALLGVEMTLVGHARGTLAAWLRSTIESLQMWSLEVSRLRKALGLAERPITLDEVARLARVAALVSASERIPSSWLEPEADAQVQAGIQELESAYRHYSSAKRTVEAEYDEAVLTLDIETLVQRFAGPYSSAFRWLRPGYYQDRAQLRAYRRDGQLPTKPLSDLMAVRTLLRRREDMESCRARWRDHLSLVDRGPDTNFDAARRTLEGARELRGLLADSSERAALKSVLDSGLLPREATTGAEKLGKALDENRRAMSSVATVLPSDLVPGYGTPLSSLPFEALRAWLETVKGLVRIACHPLDRLEAFVRVTDGGSVGYQEACDVLSEIAAVRVMETGVVDESERLQRDYGHLFCGLETPWAEILESLSWVDRVRRHFRGRPMADAFVDIAAGPRRRCAQLEPCRATLSYVTDVCDRLASRFEQEDSAVRQTSERTAAGGGRLRFEPVSSGTLRRPVDVTQSWSQLHGSLWALEERIDNLRDWVDFKGLRVSFGERGLGSLVATLQRDRIPAALLVDATRRALLQGWYEEELRGSPALRQFRGQEHEELITEFRRLDRRQWELGTHRVIRAANAHKPSADYVEPGGEADVLRREYHKARRHLPVRRLVERMPGLLRRLKPVIMMSPISVSQFLPANIAFDVVVFDEASQILPEDAVGSIYRGRQAVVCGDSKQLPPTDFFLATVEDEGEVEEEAVEATDVFQSVLEELAAARVAQAMLRWHYRSRHESLITFSNGQFYDYGLITFPSSGKSPHPLGIRFEFVPDGVYDRGRTRTNRREAERVAALILEHFRRWPERTLGVVAFSEPQREAISQALERLVDRHPEFEVHLEGDRLHGFFVKNLENVQGDERDVMIFSVGYGRDSAGDMTMNFGPLNRAGGERRLNVAITRARDEVIIVSSIRPDDIDLTKTQAVGARLLRAYLDYGERGEVALETPPNVSRGDPESPLEEDVAAAIRGLGYQVIHQVGCSRFRIDMGVLDPVRPGRFLLGVECDGATYHSAATARDRDRLREEVLERLGWKIHRVWSPDWIAARAKEVERLQRMIRAAEEAAAREVTVERGHPRNDDQVTEAPGVQVVDIPADAEEELPPEVVPYEVAQVGAVNLGATFHEPANRARLAELLRRVVSVESPIHRDLAASRVASACGIGRRGHRVESAINRALAFGESRGWFRRVGLFVYAAEVTRAEKVRAPEARDDATRREGIHIPPDEIQLAAELVLRRAGQLERERLLVRLARIFGFDRLGGNIRGHFEEALLAGTRDGLLVVDGSGRVTLPDRPAEGLPGR